MPADSATHVLVTNMLAFENASRLFLGQAGGGGASGEGQVNISSLHVLSLSKFSKPMFYNYITNDDEQGRLTLITTVKNEHLESSFKKTIRKKWIIRAFSKICQQSNAHDFV